MVRWSVNAVNAEIDYAVSALSRSGLQQCNWRGNCAVLESADSTITGMGIWPTSFYCILTNSRRRKTLPEDPTRVSINDSYTIRDATYQSFPMLYGGERRIACLRIHGSRTKDTKWNHKELILSVSNLTEDDWSMQRVHVLRPSDVCVTSNNCATSCKANYVPLLCER